MKNMFYILILLFMISCGKQLHVYDQNNLIIAGKIDNSKDKVIEIISPEYQGVMTYTTNVKDDGTFKISIPIYHYHNVTLILNDQSITLINKSSDSVFIRAFNRDSISFSGSNSKTNSDLFKLTNQFRNLYREARFDIRPNELKPDDFKEYVLDFYLKSQKFITEYSREINSSHDANVWIQARLLYKCTDELFEYGYHRKDILPTNYYNFIAQYIFDEGDASICSEFYFNYVNNYFHYKIESDNNYKPLYILLQKGKKYEFIDKYLDLIKEESDFVSEIMVTQILIGMLKTDINLVDSIYKKYDLIVSDESLKNSLMLARDIETMNIETMNLKEYKTISDLSELEIIGNIFQKLHKENVGKVLYIDFWGTWCKWCIKEFPYSKELHSQLDNNKIEFVYICSPADSTEWKNAIEQYDLNGINILLERQQERVLHSVFQISGLPRYMISNKNGEIIVEDADRPSADNIKSLLLELCEK